MYSDYTCCRKFLSTTTETSEIAQTTGTDATDSGCPYSENGMCRISPVFHFIQTAPIGQISDETAAMRVGLSSSRFRHLFKEHTGESFHQFVIRVRMERACELLRSTNLTIQQIGERIGIDLSHFRRDFKRAFGTTPAGFRKSDSNREADKFDAA